MKTFLVTALIGVAAGVIDVLPMIKMRLSKHEIVSAFFFYLIMPFIIYNTNFFGEQLAALWWLKGGILTLVLAMPTIILVAKEDKKSALPMIVMSIILGTLIGIAGRLFV